MVSAEIISKLKQEGHRITPIRTRILEVLVTLKSPISAPDLLNFIRQTSEKVNKTTIYRELEFFKSKNLINEVEFGDGKKRYELNEGVHHHHLICTNCKRIEDIDLKTDLTREEKDIEQKTGFKIRHHSLEFFGYCRSCQKL